jgi:hypothetical protein
MKKLLVIAIAALSFTACDTTEKHEETTVGTTESETMATDSYTAAEGDVMYKDNKVMVWRGGSWVEADSDVTLENGVVVSKNGEVKKDDKTIRLEDGETINRNGNIFDRAGHGIKEGWDGVKKGAREAGDAIEKGAKKVGDEAKEIVH